MRVRNLLLLDSARRPPGVLLRYAQDADISKVKALLNWQPETPIEEGLQVFADWVIDYYADRPVLEV